LLALLARGCALNNSENLVFAHDQKLFVVELHLGTAVLAEQHAVADFDIQRLTGSILAIFAFAHGDDFAFLWLLFRRVRNDDSAAYLLAFFNSPHNHAIMKRPNVYCHVSVLLLSESMKFAHKVTNNCTSELRQF